MRSLPPGRGAGSGGSEGAAVLWAGRGSPTPTQGRVGVSQLPALPALPAPVYDPARPLLGPRAFCQDPGSLERLRFCQQGFPEEAVERS